MSIIVAKYNIFPRAHNGRSRVKNSDEFSFLSNRARIMSIDLDILFDHDYQSTSICRVRFW